MLCCVPQAQLRPEAVCFPGERAEQRIEGGDREALCVYDGERPRRTEERARGTEESERGRPEGELHFACLTRLWLFLSFSLLPLFLCFSLAWETILCCTWYASTHCVSALLRLNTQTAPTKRCPLSLSIALLSVLEQESRLISSFVSLPLFLFLSLAPVSFLPSTTGEAVIEQVSERKDKREAARLSHTDLPT